MPIFTPDKASDFKPSGRILGIDIGKKTIGLAVSDSMHRMSLPLKTIKRTKYTEDIHKLFHIIQEYDIQSYILGWPLNMDGSRSGGCDRTESFTDEMCKYPDIFGDNPQILLWDERLSTEAVKEMVDKPVNKMKESGELDSLAAHIILQSALEMLFYRKN